MTGRRNGRAYPCVFVDINTQRDFCDPAGSCPVANIKDFIPALRNAIAWARRNHVPVVSSIESRRPLELTDSGTPICVDGSFGQHKLNFTLFPLRTKLEADNTLAVPSDLFDIHQQVIFRKRTDDLLVNPKADRLLTQMAVEEFMLIGAGLETSIKAAALALLARGKRVKVIVDACGYWDAGAAELALRQITAKGASFLTVGALLERRLDRRFRYPFMHRNGTHKPDCRCGGQNGMQPLNGNGLPHPPRNSKNGEQHRNGR